MVELYSKGQWNILELLHDFGLGQKNVSYDLQCINITVKPLKHRAFLPISYCFKIILLTVLPIFLYYMENIAESIIQKV